MPDRTPVSPFQDNLTLRRRGGGVGRREYPYEIPSRRLPDTLVEFASGGAWELKDVEANRVLEAGPRRVLVVPAERTHTLRMLEGRTMRSCWNMVALEDQLGRDLFTRLPHAFVLPARASDRAARVLTKLARGPGAGLAGRVAYQRLGLELAAMLLEHSPAPVAPIPPPAEERMQDVMRFIRDHLHEPLTRESLAALAHLSPTRFHYVFHEATGRPPMQYLMNQRIRRARQLLLSASLSSKEVGRLCGFASPTHFSRTFTKLAGVSPLAFRASALER